MTQSSKCVKWTEWGTVHEVGGVTDGELSHYLLHPYSLSFIIKTIKQLPMTLTLNQVRTNLRKVDFTKLPKPKKTNKGERGQLLELALGIENSSKLTDCIDGELKSFTHGQSIAITQMNHLLPEIMNDVPFHETKLGRKLKRTLYVKFNSNNEYIGSTVMSQEIDPKHYEEMEQDYNDIKNKVIELVNQKKQLATITGRNKVLQIRTSGSKKSDGTYTPLTYKGQQLKNKSMRFYITASHAKKIA